ncbi:GGDEF domain-containing protein [Lachnospira multipara]|uniref:GGDEF domain-containing protein n=1 Tax=Lachnospira multipara TaxID=28051 RepID=UPI0004E13803|nr:GGDEF domain-containing protein [Lachnospira multipara]
MDNKIEDLSFKVKDLQSDSITYGKTSLGLMSFHIAFLIFDLIYGYTFMAFINCLSISFYLVLYKLFKECKTRVKLIRLAKSIVYEIMIYMIFSTMFFGWDCGYQYWLFSMFCSYLFAYVAPDRTDAIRRASTVFFMCICLVAFVGLYIITKYVQLPYTAKQDDAIVVTTCIVNVILVFAAIGTYNNVYIRQMEYKYKMLHNIADFDQLTGLGNRYYMNDVLLEIENSRINKQNFCVAMLDIDYFKSVNDSYGHDKGDEVLKTIGKILNENLPEGVTPGRWGGEEFLIVAQPDISLEEFVNLLEIIRLKIKQVKFSTGEVDKTFSCTISVGVAQYNPNLSIPDIIKKADDNLYKAKKLGRDKLIYS